MPLQETENGVEIVDFRNKALLESAPTYSMTEASCISSSEEGRSSFELEYSDEELSIISADDHDEDEEGNEDRNDHKDHNYNFDYPSSRTFDLVIDEMPAMQGRNFLTRTKGRSKSLGTSSSLFCKPVPGNKSKKVVACPCCRSYVDCVHPKKEYRFLTSSSLSSSHDEENTPKINKLTSFVDGLWSNQKCGETDTVSDETTSSMVKSMGYTIKSRVIEGWLSKKGTGNDMFGSTSWKPRWCSLVMADITGDEQEVPLLLVSWHGSMNPSDIIILKVCIAITVDKKFPSSGEDDNIHCFDIVSTKICDHANTNQQLSNGKLTKTFSAGLEQRDEWVSKINQSVRIYQKSNALSMKHNDERSLPPTSPAREKSGRRLRNLNLNGLSIRS